VKKICWGLLSVSLIVMLAGCGSGGTSSSSNIAGDSLSHNGFGETPAPMPTSTPMPSIPSQIATPTPRPTPIPRVVATNTPSPVQNCVTYSNDMTWVPQANGTLAAPYGPAPVTGEAQQLTQQLFQLINQDRAACGLSPFAWNATLAAGALLHSWNMVHCGFSHYCPDGMSPYQRIANEGYAGWRDCGENIGLAGPYPTPWGGVFAVQESMAHEPLGGWHRIHLFSTTLHQIGIGVYVAANGWLWFTEDMVG
jgi:uncharacterized protein YkwD